MNIDLAFNPGESNVTRNYRHWDAAVDGVPIGYIVQGSWSRYSGRDDKLFYSYAVRPEYSDTYCINSSRAPATLYGAKKLLADHFEQRPDVLRRIIAEAEQEAAQPVAFLPEQDREFYPTPAALAGRMAAMVEWHKIKTVLEPSAGKGDLLDAAKKAAERFRYRHELDIDCIEIDQNLRYILTGKGYRVVHDDFLTYATNKRYDLILMNPPFSNGDAHLLHAMDMLADGGQIVCLLNAETLRNPYTNRRKVLQNRLAEVGADIRYIKGAFRDGERKTDVDVAIVCAKLASKPQSSWIFEHMKKAEQQEESTSGAGSEALTSASWIEAMIAEYNFECNAGIALLNEYQNLMVSLLGNTDNSLITLKIGGESCNDIPRSGINNYLRLVRAKHWKKLLNRPEITGKLTSEMSVEYHNKISSMADYDFTEFNIRQVIIDINSQLADGVENSILSLFDKLSEQHSWYPECEKNIHYYSGWATNKAHKINKKVILPVHGCFASSWRSETLDTYTCYGIMSDIEMVLNYLDRGETPSLDIKGALESANSRGQTKNIQFKYFKATFYKKGTVHITFNEQRLVDVLNIYASRKRGWLPPNYGRTAYSDMTAEEKLVIDEFQGAEAYSKVCSEPAYYLADISSLAALPSA